MDDAIVVSDRARSTVAPDKLKKRQWRAVDAFVEAQARVAERLRPTIARHLRTIRSRSFRESRGRAVAGIGHVRL